MVKPITQISYQHPAVEVTLSGVYSLEDVKDYHQQLSSFVKRHCIGQWYLIADVNGLEPSPMDAIEYTQTITDWILANGCVSVVNVHSANKPILDYQLEIASAGHKLWDVQTLEQAHQLVIEQQKLSA